MAGGVLKHLPAALKFEMNMNLMIRSRTSCQPSQNFLPYSAAPLYTISRYPSEFVNQSKACSFSTPQRYNRSTQQRRPNMLYHSANTNGPVPKRTFASLCEQRSALQNIAPFRHT